MSVTGKKILRKSQAQFWEKLRKLRFKQNDVFYKMTGKACSMKQPRKFDNYAIYWWQERADKETEKNKWKIWEADQTTTVNPAKEPLTTFSYTCLQRRSEIRELNIQRITYQSTFGNIYTYLPWQQFSCKGIKQF